MYMYIIIMILQSFSRVLRSVCVGACTPQWRTWQNKEIKGGTKIKSVRNLNDCKKACAKDKNCRGVNTLTFGFGKDKKSECSIVDRTNNNKKTTVTAVKHIFPAFFQPITATFQQIAYYELTRNCVRGQQKQIK